jgi:hypothetical protein
LGDYLVRVVFIREVAKHFPASFVLNFTKIVLG